MNVRVQVHRPWETDSTDILIRQDEERVWAPIQFSVIPHEPGSYLAPTISLPGTVGQQLFQAMWDEGFRPREYEGVDEALKQARQHINFAENVAGRLLSYVEKHQ